MKERLGRILKSLDKMLEQADKNPEVVDTDEFRDAYVKTCFKLHTLGAIRCYAKYLEFYVSFVNKGLREKGDGTAQSTEDLDCKDYYSAGQIEVPHPREAPQEDKNFHERFEFPK